MPAKATPAATAPLPFGACPDPPGGGGLAIAVPVTALHPELAEFACLGGEMEEIQDPWLEPGPGLETMEHLQKSAAGGEEGGGRRKRGSLGARGGQGKGRTAQGAEGSAVSLDGDGAVMPGRVQGDGPGDGAFLARTGGLAGRIGGSWL